MIILDGEIVKRWMVDAVSWWKEERELIRYGKETSTSDERNMMISFSGVLVVVDGQDIDSYSCEWR